jgi:succinate dehydrogenase hydrophobic anchor subunit
VSAKTETLVWLAQRISAMVLAPLVLVHIVTVIYAIRGG